jgi:diadenosine tetraphosphatase ApaH/serine/threonine PP2A family protein phosphatase
MRSWFQSKSNPPSIPPDLRLYVIGDIHGRADLLLRLHDMIRADAEAAPERRWRVVYLGDYVDRGPDSRGVIDILAGEPLPGFERVHLKGNHEEAVLRFLEDIGVAFAWFDFGGAATLASYGVPTPNPFALDELRATQRALLARLPSPHLAFLRSLELTHSEGDYLFVHAGVRPGVALDRQQEEDLLWIREPFLQSKARFGKVVVHGHSISYEPEFRDNRIGIDTGAFATDRLTCLVLAGKTQSLLQT